MKRLWIFPAIVCLLLLISWPFRWEKAMVQSVEKDMKLIHLRDRWTNQKWVILYGFHNRNLVSGEIEPIFSEKDIEKREERISRRRNFQNGIWIEPGAENLPVLELHQLAITELNQLAWLKRNIATGVWFGLVLSTGVLAFVMFRNNLRIEQ